MIALAHARRWVPPLVLAAVAGCHQGRDPIDRHVEDLLTIDRGIYGQITSSSDVGDPAEAYVSGFRVDAYVVPDGSVRGAPIASTASGPDRGFYQLALLAGDWLVCSQVERCVIVAVPSGAPLRLDYEWSVSPGWSGGTPWEPPRP